MGPLNFMILALTAATAATAAPGEIDEGDFPERDVRAEVPPQGTAEPVDLDGKAPPIDPYYFTEARELVLAARAGDLFQDLLMEGFAPLLWNTSAKGSHWSASCAPFRMDDRTRGQPGLEFPAAYDWHVAPQGTSPPSAGDGDPTASSADQDAPPLVVADHELCLDTHLDPEVPMIVRVTSSGHVETYYKLHLPSEDVTPFPPRRLPLLLPVGALLDALVDAAGCAGVGASYTANTLAAEACGRAEGLRGSIHDILAEHADEERR